MNLITAGLMISLSGIMVAIFVYTNSAFDDFTMMRNVLVGIGLFFAFLGIIIRIIGWKLEKKYKKK